MENSEPQSFANGYRDGYMGYETPGTRRDAQYVRGFKRAERAVQQLTELLTKDTQ